MVFLGHVMKICALRFFRKKSSLVISRKASMLNLDMKIKVSFESQNSKNVFFCPRSIFLMIKDTRFQFELHQHTGEIRTEILVYEKGGVIKHVKAPAINKVELLDL